MMIHILSYPIRQNDPAWPGNPTVSLEQYNSIPGGDVANTYKIHLFNHYGTHFDAPNHFYNPGLQIAKLPFETFLYDAPLLVDIPKQAGEKITGQDLAPYEKQINGCDLLMIRTGFGAKRTEDPHTYEHNGPAMGSDGAKYLMDHFPNVKAIALDFISLASYSDPDDGNLAHRYMLGAYHDHYICIIEDVNLAQLPSVQELSASPLKRAAAIPLRIEGIDSCPVTMWAEQS